MDATARLLLLDIEGTVSPLAFVHEVLFPFARRKVAHFLDEWSADPEAQSALDQMAKDAGKPDFASWCPHEIGSPAANAWVVAEVHALMDRDAKQTGLKGLQGLIWQEGFYSGELRAVIYPDVPPVLRKWKDSDREVRIYSSGSVHAQKLYFAHTEGGDLTPLISGYYDTTTGPKRSEDSYRAIAAHAVLEPREVLFLSDVVEELDAAAAAGMQTGLVVRPGNKPVGETAHPRIESFEQIRF